MGRGKTKYSSELAEDTHFTGMSKHFFAMVNLTMPVVLLFHYVVGSTWITSIAYYWVPAGLFFALPFALRYCSWRLEYHRWCAVVNGTKIRWVKVEALRRWHRNGQHIRRMQDLVRGDYVDVAYGTWRKDRNRFVISHAWLSAGEPDPTREQLKALVAELDRLAALDTDVVFYDYASIPQAPRTEKQTQHFKIALQNMNLLYTLEGTRVLVIPQVPKTAPNCTSYCKRGWCFFEIAVSSACLTIFNYESSAVIELLEHYKFPLSSPEFRTAFANTKFTEQGDREKVEILYDGFSAQEERKRSHHREWGFVMLLLVALIPGLVALAVVPDNK